MGTILRIYAMYEPLRVFLWLAAVFGAVAVALFARFAWFYLTTPGPTGHVQSLVVGAAFLVLSLQLAVLGILADLLRSNRLIAENTLERVRKVELELGVRPDRLTGELVDARD
jgi:hypothetical protein